MPPFSLPDMSLDDQTHSRSRHQNHDQNFRKEVIVADSERTYMPVTESYKYCDGLRVSKIRLGLKLLGHNQTCENDDGLRESVN